MSVHFSPTSGKPCSTGFATSSAARGDSPTPSISAISMLSISIAPRRRSRKPSGERRSGPIRECAGTTETGRARGDYCQGRDGLQLRGAAEALGKPTADAARKTAQRALVRLADEMGRGRD